MCRKMIYLISFVLVLGLAGYAYAGNPGDMNNPILIPATGQAPVIDGVREALWSGSEEHKCGVDAAHIVVGSKTPPVYNGPNDISASWWGLWDTQYFYLFVDVKDDVLIHDSAEIYNDDTVEVMIDIGNKDKTSYQADDYHYAFAWPLPPLNTPDGLEYQHGSQYMLGVEFLVKTHPIGQPSGYTVEVKFPWTTLYLPGKGPPKLGDLMGLDFYIDDDDGPAAAPPGHGRDDQISWYTTSPNAWIFPNLLGTVKFVALLRPPTLSRLMMPQVFSIQYCSGRQEQGQKHTMCISAQPTRRLRLVPARSAPRMTPRAC